jgi:penicillin-binding protein 1A
VWVGFDQPKTIGREAYGSRYALPIWSDFIRRTTRIRPAEAFDPPSGLHEEVLCRVSYLRPVEGCPTYTEYLKIDDNVPSRLCPIHEGSIKQRVRRAIQGALSGLGRKIIGIFK